MSAEIESKPVCNALRKEGCIRDEGYCIDEDGPPCTNGLSERSLPEAPHIIMVGPCEARGVPPQVEDAEK